MARHTNSRRDRLRYPNQQYPGTQPPTAVDARQPRRAVEDVHPPRILRISVIHFASKWSPRLERKRRVQLYNPRLKVNGRTMNTRRRGSGGFGNLDLSGTARTIFNPHKLFFRFATSN
ncbi:hypothetical protein OOU_Y34scaffold00169g1 [Pyricularia oryzae Y34]|uniref:Uncharacterized protein n=2 Tax=Pyricularia oryzae TaxID=318829 RepID=A0AA97PQB4_PYRO3|nr:hypothetical protein OOU_Y34scaffold00169g1 [Pyricularia oryzae Y34]